MPTIPSDPKEFASLAAWLMREMRKRDIAIVEHQQTIVEQQQALADRDSRLSEREAELGNAAVLIEKLKFEIARYRGWRFGKKSEAIGTEQILLWQAELDADIEALQQRLHSLQDKARGNTPSPDKDKPRRQALPATLPRIEERLEPESTVCGCGKPLQRIGEDVAETLEMVPSRLWVRRRIRGKWVCRCCERVEMAPVPAAAIDKVMMRFITSGSAWEPPAVLSTSRSMRSG